MKKRKLKLFMPLLIIAVLLAGCGESKPKPEETVTKFMESLKKLTGRTWPVTSKTLTGKVRMRT